LDIILQKGVYPHRSLIQDVQKMNTLNLQEGSHPVATLSSKGSKRRQGGRNVAFFFSWQVIS
jgi:hypothetical protein